MITAAHTPGTMRRITIIQGENYVSQDTDLIVTTVLGSCIAACIYDPYANVGGMNHFLLAEPGKGETDPQAMQRYGVYAMEMLINEMLRFGGTRNRLKARIFGGASMNRNMRDIGGVNARFARDFLRAEGIALVAEDVGGNSARRVEFRPAHGLARSRSVTDALPVERIAVAPVASASTGDVDFF